MEDYLGNCDASMSIGTFYRKYNPMVSFNNIRNNATRCANIVNSHQFDNDLAEGTLPNYSYYTPNINNVGHKTNVAYAGKWLDGFLSPRLAKFPSKTLIVISWDEDDYTEKNQFLVSLLDPSGDIFPAGSQDEQRYNHYSLLKTVEAKLWSPSRTSAEATQMRLNSIFSREIQ